MNIKNYMPFTKKSWQEEFKYRIYLTPNDKTLNEEFPKLLVVCNETDYGIEYAKFFYELEKLIITEWQNKTNKTLTDNDYYPIHFALSNSLDVRIYKKYSRKKILFNANYFLLDGVLERNITHISDFPNNRLFVSQTNIGITENKAKRNRNYFPTFIVPLTDLLHLIIF